MNTARSHHGLLAIQLRADKALAQDLICPNDDSDWLKPTKGPLRMLVSLPRAREVNAVVAAEATQPIKGNDSFAYEIFTNCEDFDFGSPV